MFLSICTDISFLLLYIHHRLIPSYMVWCLLIILLIELFLIQGADPFFILQTTAHNLILINFVSLFLFLFPSLSSHFISFFLISLQHFLKICFFSVGFQLSNYLKIHLLEFFVSMNAGKVNFDVILLRIHPFIHLFLIESFA